MFCQELNSMLCSTCSIFKPLLYKGEWPLKKMGREGSNMTDFFQEAGTFFTKKNSLFFKSSINLVRGWNETNNSRSSYSGKTYIITAWPVKHGVNQLTESGEIIVQQLAFQSVGHCFVDTEYSQSVIKQPLTQSFRQFVTHYICKSFSLPVSQSLGHPVYQVLR